MAWTSPMTFTDGQVLTAAQLNTHLRDNMMETMPAKATVNGYFVGTGPFGIAQRIPDTARVAGGESTDSTSYTDLTTVGPAIAVTTGTVAFVQSYVMASNSTADAGALMSYEISGASTRQPSDVFAIETRSGATNSQRLAAAEIVSGLTPGSHTFTCKYRVTAGTGAFTNRFISVMPL